jgi:2'-5' RNA ligase
LPEAERLDASEAKPVRLFVAVDVPDVVAAELLERIAGLRGAVSGARWTRPEGWHVTLKFLGSTAVRSVPEVEAAVRTVAGGVASFGSRIVRLGAFPSAGRARVLWAGLEDAAGCFARIVTHLDDLLVALAEPEKRAFMPHLTLARIEPPARLDPDVLELEVASSAFTVERLILYRSHLSPKGATYEPLVTAPLGMSEGA